MGNVGTVIDDVLEREGKEKVTNDPLDRGGRTQFGIAERNHPEAWADGKVTEDEARDIYVKKYVSRPGFDQLHDPGLMSQMVDFGVNSGTGIAIQKLQEVVGVEVDGVLGPETLQAVHVRQPRDVNNAVVVKRVQMIARIVQKRPDQVKFLGGWLNRSLEFLQ